MLANLLVKPGLLRLQEIKTPEPSHGEILVKIRASLTCGTDLKAFKRGHPMIPMPTVFGHEFSGVIEKTGKGVKKFRKGNEVMAVHSAPCGKCYYCRKKIQNLCENIMDTKVLGAFAEYILLPPHIVKQHVFIKPERLSFAEAAFLEPLSCVMHSINSVNISRGETAVIFGAGAIGLLHLMVLKKMGIKTIIIEKQKSRLKKAAELKSDAALNPDHADTVKKTLSATGSKGADVVFECTGNQRVWERSVRYVRKGGTIILFGGCRQGTKAAYDTGALHYNELSLKGVFHYRPSDVSQAYNLLSGRKIKVKQLISGEYPLSVLKTAFRKLSSGEGIKYAIIP
jgi:L-iditol 2-dehydrogenase